MCASKCALFLDVSGFENKSEIFLEVGRKNSSEIRDMTNEFTISIPQTEEIGLQIITTAKISNKLS